MSISKSTSGAIILSVVVYGLCLACSTSSIQVVNALGASMKSHCSTRIPSMVGYVPVLLGAVGDISHTDEAMKHSNGEYAPAPVSIEMLLLTDDESTKEAMENAINTTVLVPREGDKEQTSSSSLSSSLVSSDSFDSMVSSSSLLSSSLLPVAYPFAPPLTYKKYLTMQSKRVPVSIRYSAESGLKPYFLTVAKRIKETFPDVVLERVILPKVVVGESGFDAKSVFAGSTFEVLVDGKAVVRTAPGRKGSHSNEMTVFVSMRELDVAISRARRRRRPSTVYGEGGDLEDNRSRLEIMKSKADEINSRKSSEEKQQ